MPLRAKITGSGAINLAKALGIPFVQEVVAVADALRREAPQTDVAIELGGEDAKIIYFGTTLEERMNGVCAGGTGSFIDQMAALLQTDAAGALTARRRSISRSIPSPRAAACLPRRISSPHQRGGDQGGPCRIHLSGSRQPDHLGLACGKPIRGHVAFLGGPLHFLPQLKAAFIRTLKLTDETAIDPPNSHLFAAMGAALDETACEALPIASLIDRLTSGVEMAFELHPACRRCLPRRRTTTRSGAPRAGGGGEGETWQAIRAAASSVWTPARPRQKLALIGERGELLLWSYYANNQGSPIETAKRAVSALARELPESAHILRECSTGYGEALLKAAFSLDEGEVETIAHCTAAAFFRSAGGLRAGHRRAGHECIKLHNGSVDNVLLNEACSSGCGSFIENFAASLGYSAEDFAQEALFAPHPVDLGTRCTVFMNSNVKQAQKEGAGVPDISAGFAYSVIKNALYKVIKLSPTRASGAHVVVQGGTFYNKAVLRAFERISGRRQSVPTFGTHGRVRRGADRPQPLPWAGDRDASARGDRNAGARRRRCTAAAAPTADADGHALPGGRRYTTGNRCERPRRAAQKKRADLSPISAKRLFAYPPLCGRGAPRGELGIPRVLNMYENYPFWATFFKASASAWCSRRSPTAGSTSAAWSPFRPESECYPAKLAHGHVQWLIDEGVHTIFHPCVFFEHQETPDAQNHFQLPHRGVLPRESEEQRGGRRRRRGGVSQALPCLHEREDGRRPHGALLPRAVGIPEKETRQAVSLPGAEQQSVRRISAPRARGCSKKCGRRDAAASFSRGGPTILILRSTTASPS